MADKSKKIAPWTATIDDVGNLKLSEEYLKRMNLKPGQKVRITVQEDGSLCLKAGKDVLDLVGMLDCNGFI